MFYVITLYIIISFETYTRIIICFDHVLIQIEDISISTYIRLPHSFYGYVVFHGMYQNVLPLPLMDLEVVLCGLVGDWLTFAIVILQ